jgi:ferredoxin
MPVSRRALMGLGGALGELETHPGLRLYTVVRELLGGAPVPSGLDDVLTGSAQLEAAQCCGSGVCVLACPAQALTLTVTDLVPGAAAPSARVVGAAAFSDEGLQQFVLNVDPALCIDCGQCVEMCPESAMSRVGPLPWAQALNGMQTTLQVGMVRRCSRCGMPNRDPDTMCAVCTFRTAEPFGSLLPAGFTRAPS